MKDSAGNNVEHVAEEGGGGHGDHSDHGDEHGDEHEDAYQRLVVAEAALRRGVGDGFGLAPRAFLPAPLLGLNQPVCSLQRALCDLH